MTHFECTVRGENHRPATVALTCSWPTKLADPSIERISVATIHRSRPSRWAQIGDHTQSDSESSAAVRAAHDQAVAAGLDYPERHVTMACRASVGSSKSRPRDWLQPL